MLIGTLVVYGKTMEMHLVGFEAMDLLYPPESTNAKALAPTRGVNASSRLLPDEGDLVCCRGLGDAIKWGSHDDELPTKGYLEQNHNN